MKTFTTPHYAQSMLQNPAQSRPTQPKPQLQPQQPMQQAPQQSGVEVEGSDPDLEHEQALEQQEQQVLNGGDHQQGGMERLPGGIKPPGNPSEPDANPDAWHPEQEQTGYPAGTFRKAPGQWPAGGLGEAFNQDPGLPAGEQSSDLLNTDTHRNQQLSRPQTASVNLSIKQSQGFYGRPGPVGQIPPKEHLCPDCKGTGRTIKDGVATRCWSCNGNGIDPAANFSPYNKNPKYQPKQETQIVSPVQRSL